MKKTIVLVLSFVLVISSFAFSWGAADNTSKSIGPYVPSQKIAIYADTGVDSQTVAALCMAFSRMGHKPMTIAMGDILHNRVTIQNFDVLVLPAAEQGSIDSYLEPIIDGNNYDFSDEFADAITNFANSGGGVIGIETGARLLCSTGQWNGTAEDYFVDLYSGSCTGPLNNIGEGMAQIGYFNQQTLTSKAYTLYVGRGAPYFNVTPQDTVFANYIKCGSDSNKAAIMGFDYGSGHVCLVGPNLELEEDSQRDYSVWDNLKNYEYDNDTEIGLLAKIVEFAALGSTNRTTVIKDFCTYQGKRIAVYSLHDENGGAWPGYMGAITKAVLNAGHTPLAINADDIKNGMLTTSNFDAIVFPGGYSPGYWNQLSGYENEITDFIDDGGGCMAICAGSFYLSNIVDWEGSSYNYPVDLFSGTATGPITDIAPWPQRVMTPIHVNDLGLGINSSYNVTYYGGPYFHDPVNQTIIETGKYTHQGATNNEDAIIRFNYGNGKVVLFGPHPETEEGSTADWTWWDNFEYNSPNAQTDPDSEWPLIDACLDWITSSNSSNIISDSDVTLGVIKTVNDTTEDSLCDAQREDGTVSASIFNDGWYTIYRNKTMELSGFGKKPVDTIHNVDLKVKMYVETSYNGNNSIMWSTDGTTYHNTGITPSNSGFHTFTFDLEAAGVDTEVELQGLRIKFNNNSSNTYYSYVSFDYIHVEVN